MLGPPFCTFIVREQPFENGVRSDNCIRRMLHHKILIGYNELTTLEDFHRPNALYGTYNLTNAAPGKLESVIVFDGDVFPSTVQKLGNEVSNLFLLTSHKTTYQNYLECGDIDEAVQQWKNFENTRSPWIEKCLDKIYQKFSFNSSLETKEERFQHLMNSHFTEDDFWDLR